MKKARKYLSLLLAILCTMSLLAGCGQSDSGEAKAEAPAGDSQTLIVYTARSESLNNAVIENFEADTGIHVEVVTGGTGEVLKRVQSESSNPQGDICWAADEAMLKDYADYFETYVSPRGCQHDGGLQECDRLFLPRLLRPHRVHRQHRPGR